MSEVSEKLNQALRKIKTLLDSLGGVRQLLAEEGQDTSLAENLQKTLVESEQAVREELSELSMHYDAIEFKAERDMVFGDHHEHHHYAIVFETSVESDSAQAPALQRYLRRLQEQLQYLKLPPVDSRHADMSEQKQAATLHDVFVALETWPIDERLLCNKKNAEAPDIRTPMDEERKPELLSKAVSEHRVAVILGKPGSGKTTFVRRLILSLVDGDPLQGWPDSEMEYIPVHIELRWFAQWLTTQSGEDAGLFWRYIKQELGKETLDLVMPELRKRAENQQLLVVLDGLDEVPFESAQPVCRVIQNFIELNPGNRFILTCRILSWAEQEWRLQEGLPLLGIRDFQDHQIKDFIQAWYQTARRRWGLAEADTGQRINSLLSALEHERLKEIKRIPLLLTIMAMVHTQHQKLPNELAILYSQAVKILISRWDVLESEHADHQLNKILAEGQCEQRNFERVLDEIAWQVHPGAEKGKQQGLADIPESLLKEKIAALRPNDRFSSDWAEKVLLGIRLRAGLLLPVAVGGNEDLFQFPHRSFQEFMAGRFLAGLDDFGKGDGLNPKGFTLTASELVGKGNYWRYVVLFAAGVLIHGDVSRREPLRLLNQLCPEQEPNTDSDWRRIWMAGEILVEMRRRTVELDASPELAKRIHQRLIQLVQQGQLNWRDRVEVAELLNHSDLGDNRAGIQSIEWQKVVKSHFIMGSDKNDSQATNWEYHSPRQIEMPYDYLMARFPVTVAQYAEFLQDTKSNHTLEDWQEQSIHPNRPVVSVSWRDAKCWCEWASGQLPNWASTLGSSELKKFLDQGSCIVRLPTEAEWEYAARGIDGRRFPWGYDNWQADKALLNNSEIEHAVSVGLFPQGCNEAVSWSLFDMSGNIWEWTLSKWHKYPYADETGAIYPERNKIDDSDNRRVVRGGAFDYLPWDGRCAWRQPPPDHWFRHLGFRVIVSLANSVF